MAASGRIEPFGGRDPMAALDPSRKSGLLISTFPSSVNRRREAANCKANPTLLLMAPLSPLALGRTLRAGRR
jgi:hypothetical protein